MGTLYIVATPIGNLEDITLRALRILKEVSAIYCEDTRQTKKLLSHFDIATPVHTFHQHSTDRVYADIASTLHTHAEIALVTDAGTPGVSDPGNKLIAFLRKQLPETKIIPLPGASAVTTLLSVAGFPADEFTFVGFFPNKKGRETLAKEIAANKRTSVFFESPHRIHKTLELLRRFLEPSRVIIIGRELTKQFETISYGSLLDVCSRQQEIPAKGEFVVAVSGTGFILSETNE